MATAFEGNYAARGSVTLKSADPKDPPVIDPKFLEEPFDRRVAIEAVRETLNLMDSPQMAKEQVRLAAAPEDRSDEAILVCSYYFIVLCFLRRETNTYRVRAFFRIMFARRR